MRAIPLLLITAALFAAGCGTPSEPVRLAVRNDAAEPVTLWLTKDGPPVETAWLSPGQLAAIAPPDDSDADVTRLPAVVLEPGVTAVFPRRNGKFPPGARPVLRVFRGPDTLGSLNALASVPRRSDDVDTVPLAPGDGGNRVVVRSANPVEAELVGPGELDQ